MGPFFRALKDAGTDAGRAFHAYGMAFEGYVKEAFRQAYPDRPPLVNRVLYSPAVPGRPGDEAFDIGVIDGTAGAVLEVTARFLT